MTLQPDGEIVAAMTAGDHEAFAVLVTRYARTGIGIAMRTVCAEDIVQALQQAPVEGGVFRSSTTFVFDDGSEEKDRNVQTIALVRDRYRYERTTTDGRLASVTWSVPENDEYVVTKHLAYQKSTRVRRVSREEGLGASPIARVLEISWLID